ncbi:MAG TPA: thiamine pyrophosphate-binding protein, partial [Jiangellaceae bacterium]|nr:thiamine pyrophosphate-binding protein [Jiangellaceae bacterium]
MRVAEAVGRTLARLGVRQAFGVVGSGNFDVTNALIDEGARYVGARHEGGAATMADAYARLSGEVAALTVHQGCGLTNAMTGITEAAKSRTPLLVLAAEATAATSNFAIDQAAMARAVGAQAMRVSSADTAVDDAIRAFSIARDDRRTVLVNLPLEVQGSECAASVDRAASNPPAPVEPVADVIAALAAVLADARRPVLIAGRGARHARSELLALGDVTGALLATSAVAKGLFHGSP